MNQSDDGRDARIRAGLGAVVEDVDPSLDDSWTSIRQEAGRPANGSHQGLAAAAIAAIVLFVVVAAMVVARRSGTEVTAIPPQPSSSPHASLVAVNDHGDLVELGVDGTVMREIAKGPFRGRPAVTPDDARTIYIERLVADDVCTTSRVPEDQVIGEIVAVPWRGGASEVVAAQGTAPAIGGNGRWLAYVGAQPSPDGTVSCRVPVTARSLFTMDLPDGRITPLGGASGREASISEPAWIDTSSLVGLFSVDHRCEALAPPSACTTRYLQDYLVGVDASGSVGPVGTVPPDSTSVRGVTFADVLQLPFADSLSTEGPGVLVTAGVADGGATLVTGRVTFDNRFGPYGTFGTSTETARIPATSLGLAAIDRVTISSDPRSRLAVSVLADDGTTLLLVGPATDLQPVGRSVSGAAWAFGP